MKYGVIYRTYDPEYVDSVVITYSESLIFETEDPELAEMIKNELLKRFEIDYSSDTVFVREYFFD